MRVQRWRAGRRALLCASVGLAVATAAACGSSSSGTSAKSPAANATAPASAAPTGSVSAVQSVLDYDKTGAKGSKTYSLAFLASCETENTYCQQGVAGVKAAASKYGATVKVYDAVFNPATQLGQVQDAATHGYDGYLFEPAASASACTMWKQYLKPTGKPVVILDLPMCDDATHTAGTAALVTMQRTAYFQEVIDNAFKTCTSACEVAAVGGSTGSDLFSDWETALKRGAAKNSNIKIVVDQPGNFDPRTAFTVIQNGLRAHPNISMVVSSWDAMTLGAEQALVAGGKKPGTDVKIFSVGGTKDAIAKVTSNTWNATYVLLPYQEGYFATVATFMAIAGKPVNDFVNEELLPPIVDGPKTIAITAANASSFHPDY